jgi:hypothetical protein
MNWVALGESVTGTSHRSAQTPCQDSFRYRLFGEAAEWLLVAAADGAGSAAHADVGATLVCDEFARRVEESRTDALLTRQGIIALFAETRLALLAEAERRGARPRDLACTALFGLVGPTTAAFAQLGDGAIVIGDGQAHRVVFWPDSGEYVNATDFLTDEGFADLIRFETTTDPISEVALLTDGLQRLALDFAGRTAHPGFFAPLFKRLRGTAAPESLLEPLRSFFGFTASK